MVMPSFNAFIKLIVSYNFVVVFLDMYRLMVYNIWWPQHLSNILTLFLSRIKQLNHYIETIMTERRANLDSIHHIDIWFEMS